MGKHCNNSQCFKKKLQSKILNQLNILKKIDRDNFRKKITKQPPKKEKKNHVGNTVVIHSVL
jgi:hypothetical protein